jgi:hypothetical protein
MALVLSYYVTISALAFQLQVPEHTLSQLSFLAAHLTTIGNREAALLEAKLTEGNFQIQCAELVEPYRDLREVFEARQLPRAKRKYVSYQLIRNVLAAHALGLDFCTLLDARRPDLIEDWYRILRCIRSAELRARCKVLIWQELAPFLSSALKNFLDVKYGIVPAN